MRQLEKIELYLIEISNDLYKKNLIDAEELKKVIYIYCNTVNNIEKDMCYRILNNINEDTIINNNINYNNLLMIFANEHTNKIMGVK